MSRTIAIVQARMGSTRLPGKVLRPILGRPMLFHVVQRLGSVREISSVVVATSDREGDEPIREFCREQAIACFAGSEADVLDRFYRCAVAEQGDPLIRITADCPLVDPALVARLIAMYRTSRFDYVSVATGAGAIRLEGGRFPDGLDAECFGFEVLQRAWQEAKHPLDREHVTPYIWRNKNLFRCGHVLSEIDYSAMRWTVDNEQDLALVTKVYEALHPANSAFTMSDVLGFLAAHRELADANRAFIGREGYEPLWRVPQAPERE